MLTTRWNPILPAAFSHLRHEFDEALRTFDESENRRRAAAFTLPLTAWEDDERIYLEADAPGFTPETLDVRYQDGRIWVAGERPVSKADGDYAHNERMFGRFERSVSLPAAIDPASIKAELHDGVLHVSMRKAEQAQRVRISIKGAAENDGGQ